MFGQYLGTPKQDKYRGSQWSTKKDRSTTFSHLNKSYSNYKSTEIGDHSPFRSGAISRLDEAKRSIDSVICDLEDYRDMNSSAFKEVRGTNYEIVEELRRNYQSPQKENVSPFIGYQPNQTPSWQMPPQQDGNMLRNMLNQQTQKSNALLLQLARLEEQNKMLRNQGGNGELQMQNERLKRALSQMSQLPQQIYAEIEDLKRQNEGLRKDTVKLLRKADCIL